MNPWPIFQPQDSASDLADHPHLRNAPGRGAVLRRLQGAAPARTTDADLAAAGGGQPGNGLSVSAFGSGFMALVFLPAARQDFGRPGFPLPLVILAFFALLAYSSFSGAWKQNAYRRVAPLLEAARCTYAIRNAAFAQAFLQRNHRLAR